MDNICITFHSLIKSPASWATITRNLIKELYKKNIDVQLIPQRGFLYDKNFKTSIEVEKSIQKKINCPISTSFNHPSFYKKLKGKIKTSFLVYETFPLPKEWVENINKYLDYVFVPNNYNKNIFIKSGVQKSKIIIVPYGYPGKIKPKIINTNKKTTEFLTIATPHKRKGLKILIQAFCQAFTGKDKVSLTIKTSYTPKISKKKPWETEDIKKIISSSSKMYPNPPKIILKNAILNDDEMLNYYKQHDVYVQPSYAEGYGLSILEAMASGLLCVVTGYGGHMEFCNENNSLLINYKLSYRKNMAYCEIMSEKYIKVAIPDKKHLSQILKEIHENKNKFRKITEYAIKSIRNLTWENCTNILIKELHKIKRKHFYGDNQRIEY